jgi:predicted PhzF superfamily epimerase YddE/YHI9
MDQRPPGTPEVLKFAPKQRPRDEGDPIDQAGHALVAMLHEAAKLSNENVDRAMTMAHKLSIQLRAAEDRISQLQAEVEHLESRATRAEQWLQQVKKEIEDKLIGPMEANRPELPVRR